MRWEVDLINRQCRSLHSPLCWQRSEICIESINRCVDRGARYVLRASRTFRRPFDSFGQGRYLPAPTDECPRRREGKPCRATRSEQEHEFFFSRRHFIVWMVQLNQDHKESSDQKKCAAASNGIQQKHNLLRMAASISQFAVSGLRFNSPGEKIVWSGRYRKSIARSTLYKTSRQVWLTFMDRQIAMLHQAPLLQTARKKTLQDHNNAIQEIFAPHRRR